MNASTDIIYRVVDEDSDTAFDVQVDVTNNGFVMVANSPSQKSLDYWGIIDLHFTKQFARELGKALIKCSEGE